jgi:hypothetical protein
MRRNPLHHPQAELKSGDQHILQAYLRRGDRDQRQLVWKVEERYPAGDILGEADDRSKEGCHLLLRNAALI